MESALKGIISKKETEETVNELHRQISFSEDINEFLPDLIEDLKIIFDCEAVTLFAVDQSTHQLYSKNYISDKISEIRVSISLKNLAGFVAGTGNSLNIFDVKDEVELSQYHPQLSHDSSWDALLDFNTKSIIVVPIPFNKSLVGILQIINKKTKDHFSVEEFQLAKKMTPALGIVLSRLKTETIKHNISKSGGTVSGSPDDDTDSPETEQTENPELIPNNLPSVKKEQEDNWCEESLSAADPQLPFDDEEPQAPSVVTAVLKEPQENGSDEVMHSNDVQLPFEDDEPQAFPLIVTAVKKEPEENYSEESVAQNDVQLPFKEDELPATPENNIAVNGEAEENGSEESVAQSDAQPPIGEAEIQTNSEDPTAVTKESEDSKENGPDDVMPANDVQPSVCEVEFPTNSEDITAVNDESENFSADRDESKTEDKKVVLEKSSPGKPTKFSYLVENNLITEKALASSISHAERNQLELESVLLQQVEIKREDLGLALANFYDLPYFGFRHSVVLPQQAIGGLNKNFLAKNYWLPIKSSDSKVVILINDPSNPDKLQNIKHIFSRKEIEFKIGLKIDIIDFLNSVLEQGEAHFEEFKSEKMSSLISTLQENSKEEMSVTEDKDETEEIQTVKETDGAIIRLVNKILSDAYEREVSDIHIEPGTGKDNVLVRFRKEGECHSYEEIPAVYKQGIISRIKIMAHLDIAEKRLPQDGKFKARYGNKHVEFRVATCPTVGGNEDAVLRILAQSKMAPLEKMNFTPKNLALIKKIITKPYGLILVVGPTGSGKTTTLHSCLNEINTPKKKIWTAEDPVEITQKGLRQVQILEKKGLNFARAMRSFLRGDPDVIMVGEMRDKETANIGLEASLTGHLVLSTLHTNSAPETITRLLDMGMNPLNFADSLLLIIAQRLVKTLCKECRQDYQPSIEEFDILVNEFGKEDFQKLGIEYNNLLLKKPAGCRACENTGYAGRIAIHELLEGTPSINRLIVKQATVEQLRIKAKEEGMTTLKQDGIQKVLNGDCDLVQILSVCMV